MPCVGHHRGAVDLAADAGRVAVEQLFGDDRHDGRPQRHGARLRRQDTPCEVADGPAAAPQQFEPHARKREADEQRGQRLVFAVSVVVVVVARLGRHAHEEQHHQIGGEVRRRVDGVGHHRRTVPQDACGQFSGAERQIDRKSDPCDAIDGPFAGVRLSVHAGCRDSTEKAAAESLRRRFPLG